MPIKTGSVKVEWSPEQIDQLSALRDQLDECIGCGCLSLDRCAIYNPEDKAVTLGPGARYLLGNSADDLPSPE